MCFFFGPGLNPPVHTRFRILAEREKKGGRGETGLPFFGVGVFCVCVVKY